MQDNIRSITCNNWDAIDADAKKLNMNRSQFVDYLYNYWKKGYKKPTVAEIVTLIGLAFILILLLVFNL